jgi:transcriptional regulator with XRE-family HTH domain
METREIIKQRRIELGMSQEDLAKKVGYAGKSAISKLEAGERKIYQAQLLVLAKALQTTPSFLLGYDDTQITPTHLKKLGFDESKINKLNDKDFDLIKSYIKGILDSKQD